MNTRTAGATGQPVVGWLGAGRIGAPMAERLLARGYRLLLCEPREEARLVLVRQGAEPVATPAACADQAALVFSSLPNDAALQDVAFGEGGLFDKPRVGLIFVETSTVSARLSERIAHNAQSSDTAYLRMPVSGNPSFAREGQLTAFVSGPAEAWAAAKPLVQCFTKTQRYLGTGEQARYMKLAVNLLVANAAPMMAEALALERAGGLDWAAMLDALAEDPLASPWLLTKLDALRRRDFTPTFPPWLMPKDIDLMLDAGRDRGVPLTMTAVTRQVMQALTVEDYADEDFFVAIRSLERQSGFAPLKEDDMANNEAEAAGAEVLAMEDKRYAAMTSGDLDALGHIFADDMAYTHSSGLIDDKPSYIRAMRDGNFAYRKVERSNAKVSLAGDAALVTGRIRLDIMFDTGPRVLDSRFLSVWVRLGQQWRHLAWQSTPIPA